MSVLGLCLGCHWLVVMRIRNGVGYGIIGPRLSRGVMRVSRLLQGVRVESTEELYQKYHLRHQIKNLWLVIEFLPGYRCPTPSALKYRLPSSCRFEHRQSCVTSRHLLDSAAHCVCTYIVFTHPSTFIFVRHSRLGRVDRIDGISIDLRELVEFDFECKYGLESINQVRAQDIRYRGPYIRSTETII